VSARRKNFYSDNVVRALRPRSSAALVAHQRGDTTPYGDGSGHRGTPGAVRSPVQTEVEVFPVGHGEGRQRALQGDSLGALRRRVREKGQEKKYKK